MPGRSSLAEIFSILFIALSLALVSWRVTQTAADGEFALRLDAADGRETKMSIAEIAKLPHIRLRAKDEKGRESLWEGASLNEVLKAAGVKFGEAIRGAALANYLLVEAADGYRVVFALPELDPAFSDQTFLLAYRRDGRPMDENDGQLRIIIPHEKRHARWVRRVVALSIRSP